MLNIAHSIISDNEPQGGQRGRFNTLYGLMKSKMSSYLRLLATKNAINRASDYHYLNLAVTSSTEPVNGIDYIHPVVSPAVDYISAVIAKCLLPNGEVNFEFQPDGEWDEMAARQSTDMVSRVINEQNDPYTLIHSWAQDACLHKNGLVMVCPLREEITFYREIEGTKDQLRAFEIRANERGLTARRTSTHKVNVDLEGTLGTIEQGIEEQGIDPSIVSSDLASEALVGALEMNTVYRAKYKLTGYRTRIKYVPIAQHYWICDPTVTLIQDQPFCGFYNPMTIQEATELYPGIDLELFMKYSDYSNVGAYQAGSLINNLALHARDSVPINGLPSAGYDTNEGSARQITVITVWNKYDIDGDGELELVEIVYSGRYIISAKEVEFIPVANMCPKPLPQNFYGYSIAERVVPQQEYCTSIIRAELQMAMYASTPRIGVNPEYVDMEQLQDGESSIFVLDRKFDPNIHIWQPQPLQGNLGYVTDALERQRQDTMSLIGMTSPSDMLNPDIMGPGNSGVKLQTALGPNQIIQDNVVKNCASALRDLLWLTWRTLVLYGDDYGILRLASASTNEDTPFLDYQMSQEMMFNDRKAMNLELAVGLMSEENKLQRQALIIQTQQGFAIAVSQLQQSGIFTSDLLRKLRKPFEDTLYTLGVKDCDQYLPTEEEIMQGLQQKAQAAEQAGPNPEEQAKSAKAQLDLANAEKIRADVAGTSAERILEAAALKMGKSTSY